ncbi:hypothetical protein TURU_006047 [Turdus rufiventris]|nr:hypothetical protein TURU_006047 [Turdus rufiventris]
MDLINGLLDKKVDTRIQRTVVNGSESSRHQSQVSLRSPHWYCYPVLFTVSINNIDEGIECILSKFEDDTKLRVTVDSLERWNDIQRYLDKLKKRANGNLRRFNRISPFLTWRDVQHIIVRTSRAGHLNANDWKTNAAGYKGGKIVTNDKEMNEVVNTFLPFNGSPIIRPIVLWVPELEDRNGEKNESPIIQDDTKLDGNVDQLERKEGSAEGSGQASSICEMQQVSHLYGFGLMDAEAMVTEAEKWTTVPPQHVCVENTDRQIKTIRPDSIVRSIYKATGCSDNPNHHVIYLEHVVVRITITHPRRGDLAIYLTSPSGTRSQLLANRLFDHSMEGFKNWEFMTTHCWSEKAAGDWILEICDTPSQLRNFKTPGKLKEWSLVLYGTSIQPYSPRNDFSKVERVRSSPVEDPTEDYTTDDYSGPCNAECSKVGCDGPGPDHCTDCLHYYYKSKNNTRICVSTCPPGHYNADKKRCKKCSPNCETCVGGHNDQCMTCKSGYYLNEVTNSCITSCPDGFYLDKNKVVCRKCSENCKTCVEFQTCTECRHGLRCDASCLDCSGQGDRNCTSCPNGYNLDTGVCVIGTVCKDGEYLDDSQECQLCDISCQKCIGPESDNCISCPPTRFFDDGYCVKQCPRGKFEFEQQCHLCHHTCLNCSGSEPNKCTACGTDRRGVERFLYHGECRDHCPPGHYHSEHTCVPCPGHCEVCLNSSHCKRCFRGYYLTQNVCEKHSCREGISSIATNTVQKIPTEMKVLGSVETVLATVIAVTRMGVTHVRKAFISQGQVLDFDDIDGPFQSNIFYDYTTSVSILLRIFRLQGKFLIHDTCVSSCPPKYFGNVASGKCEMCGDGCEVCSDEWHCQKCQAEQKQLLFLHNGRCLQECPKGYFNDSETCKECSGSCKTCMGSATQCLSCKSPFLLEHGKCKSTCSEKHFAYEGICKRCPQLCQECIHDETCTECMDEFFLHEGKCVQECPSHFYPEDKHCFPCHADCKDCNGPHSDDCTACTFSWFILYNGMCFEDCPDGSYYEEATKDCQEPVLKHAQKDIMLTAWRGNVLNATAPVTLALENTAHSAFPANWVGSDKEKHVYPNVQQGKEAFSCTSCVWSYSLLNGMCNSDCFVGEYKVQETPGEKEKQFRCERCDSSCTECKGPGPLNCTVCPASMQLFLEESRCLSCCSNTDPEETPECCDCNATQDDCVLQTTQPPGQKSKTIFFVITCILLLLVIGAIVFIWRKAQTKTQPLNKGRYEKLTNHSKNFPSSVSSYHKNPSYHEDQVIEYRDRDYDDDDEDDIVYMGKDGTIYHKFKYGLLDDDEEDELEYDDESYSFR